MRLLFCCNFLTKEQIYDLKTTKKSNFLQLGGGYIKEMYILYNGGGKVFAYVHKDTHVQIGFGMKSEGIRKKRTYYGK